MQPTGRIFELLIQHLIETDRERVKKTSSSFKNGQIYMPRHWLEKAVCACTSTEEKTSTELSPLCAPGCKVRKICGEDTRRIYMAEITQRISSPHIPFAACAVCARRISRSVICSDFWHTIYEIAVPRRISRSVICSDFWHEIAVRDLCMQSEIKAIFWHAILVALKRSQFGQGVSNLVSVNCRHCWVGGRWGFLSLLNIDGCTACWLRFTSKWWPQILASSKNMLFRYFTRRRLHVFIIIACLGDYSFIFGSFTNSIMQGQPSWIQKSNLYSHLIYQTEEIDCDSLINAAQRAAQRLVQEMNGWVVAWVSSVRNITWHRS